LTICRDVSVATAIYAILGGLVTFAGWSLDIVRLTDWNNDGISMFPNTALCAVLGGTALILLAFGRDVPWRRNAARVLGLCIALVGGLTMIEHMADVNLGIDTLLSAKTWGQRASTSPMRMGPPASVSFLILGSAICLSTFGAESRRFGSELAVLVAMIASLSLIGYWFGADQLFGIARITGIAWQSSTMLLALSIGLMASVAEHGIVAALRRNDAGGTVLRRLILPIIIVPLGLGWLRLIGQEAGLFDLAFGTAIRTVGEIVLLFCLLWWTANGISAHARAAREADEERRESELRFRVMTDAAPVLMWMTDTNKGLTWVNKQWLDFVGQSFEHELGDGWIDSVHPEDRARCATTYRTTFDEQREFSIEYRVRRHDGVYRWMLDHGIPRYDSSGKFTGYIGSCVDITQRKEAEEAAREADRRKDEFLATLAHELRNPLAPIGNALQLIQHAGSDATIFRNAQTTMQRQFSQMVRLVDDLLDVGRITRDKLELRVERVELQTAVRQAVEASQSMAEQSGHQLRVEMPDTPIWIDADPVRLSQVFSNLLNNACKFTEQGGSIIISAERRNGDAVVTVKDTGIGIAPDKLASVFEMFEQVDKSLERTRSGLGIGLTLVKRLVELHGGTITAASDGLGKGSAFIVLLPARAEEPRPDAAPQPAAPKRGDSRRILVTDDNRDSANSLALLLKLGGHQVDTAYDGVEAVRKAEANRPEVILLDIGMPGMNGYDVCRSIRNEPWGKEIRIVALTGWGQDQDHRNTRDAGFDHHLVKPVTASALHEALAP
jgi:PAS domain S-box-containing protein